MPAGEKSRTETLIGGLITMSWWGALTAFFWTGLVRVAVLHHVTWSVNSLCRTIGDRPYAARDKSANLWPLGCGVNPAPGTQEVRCFCPVPVAR